MEPPLHLICFYILNDEKKMIEPLYKHGKFVILNSPTKEKGKEMIVGMIISNLLVRDKSTSDTYYRYGVKTLVKDTNVISGLSRYILTPLLFDEWELEKSDLDVDSICDKCPKRLAYPEGAGGHPGCVPFCDFDIENYPNEDDEDTEEEIDTYIVDDEKDEGKTALDKCYTIADYDKYVKCQTLAFKVRKYILGQKKEKYSATNSNNFVISTRVSKTPVDKKRSWWGEINIYLNSDTKRLFRQRLSLHLSNDHIPFDTIDEKRMNDDEVEYWLDGPKERNEILKKFGPRKTKHL